MGARHKMVRTLLAVMAAVALSLACADPTPATTAAAVPEAPLTPDSTTTTTAAVSEGPTATIGPQTLYLDNYTGTWWAYNKRGHEGPFSIAEMEITRKTPEEIAVYEHSWLPRNNSQNETNQDHSDSINWQNVSLVWTIEAFNNSYTSLIEVLPNASHFKIINSDGSTDLMRFKYTNGTLIFRQVGGAGTEFSFHRSLPDLATFVHCENFDLIDASDTFDLNSLVGIWTTNRHIRGDFYTLRVTSKTAEEISEYKDDLRNTTIEEADIDWTKVRLQAELFSMGNEVKAVGIIEELDKPGFIRVIPLKETWDDFGRTEVENWFTSQNLIIKRDDGLLAVKNCDRPWQKAYFVRRPQQKRRKMPWKPNGGMGGKKKNY